MKLYRPTRGVCLAIWEMFDSATGTILPEHLPRLADMMGWNALTVKTQFGHWRKFQIAQGVQLPDLPKPAKKEKAPKPAKEPRHEREPKPEAATKAEPAQQQRAVWGVRAPSAEKPRYLTRFFNEPAECQSLLTDQLSGLRVPSFASYVIHGESLERPARIDLYANKKPAYNDKPIAIYRRGEASALHRDE